MSQFQAERAPSLGPKFAIIVWYLFCVAAAWWYTDVSTGSKGVGDPVRQVVMLACVMLYVARAAHTLFSFVTRRVPWWEAAWGGSIIGLVLFFFLRAGFQSSQPLGPLDGVALLLYISGSYLGTASERARHLWKARPEHNGHIYTEGLFHYSRHINYFADLMLFVGLAMLTQQWWAGFVPLFMGLNFVVVIIPAHDAYLAARYGPEFDEYARRTPRLVPFIY